MLTWNCINQSNQFLRKCTVEAWDVQIQSLDDDDDDGYDDDLEFNNNNNNNNKACLPKLEPSLNSKHRISECPDPGTCSSPWERKMLYLDVPSFCPKPNPYILILRWLCIGLLLLQMSITITCWQTGLRNQESLQLI